MPLAKALSEAQPAKRDLLGPDVGRRIRAARQRKGFTLAQTGGEELSRSFLSLVESGRSRISLRALAIVADRLDIPIGHFLEDEDSRRAAELALDYAEIELEKGNAKQCIRTLDQNKSALQREARAAWLRGRALIKLSDFEPAAAALHAALELARSDSDSTLTAEILHSLAGSLYASHKYEEALACAREGLQLALQDPRYPALQARLYTGIGHILYVQNQLEDAITHYDRARELYGSLYDLGNVGAVFSGMSIARRKQGNLAGALQYSGQSVAAFRLKRDWRQVARELNNMATRHRDLGNLESAEETATESIERAEGLGAEDIEALARSTLASIYLRQGRLEEAEAEARRAEELAANTVPLAQIDAWVVQGRIAALKRQPDRTDEFYRKALDKLSTLDHEMRVAETALEFSRLLRERGDTEAALDFAIQAAEAKGGRLDRSA